MKKDEYREKKEGKDMRNIIIFIFIFIFMLIIVVVGEDVIDYSMEMMLDQQVNESVEAKHVSMTEVAGVTTKNTELDERSSSISQSTETGQLTNMEHVGRIADIQLDVGRIFDTQQESEKEDASKIKILDDVTLYECPDDSSTVLGEIKEGTVIPDFEEAENGFLKISSEGVDMYFYYLNTTYNQEGKIFYQMDYKRHYGEATEELSLMESPGMASKEIGKVPKDERFRIIKYVEIANNEDIGWLLIERLETGEQGFVYAENVREEMTVYEDKFVSNDTETTKTTAPEEATSTTAPEEATPTTAPKKETIDSEVPIIISQAAITVAQAAKTTTLEKETSITAPEKETIDSEVPIIISQAAITVAQAAKTTTPEEATSTTAQKESTEVKNQIIKEVTIERDNVIMYTKPNDKSKVVCTLKRNDKVTEVEEVGRGWLKMTVNGVKVYAYYLYTDYAKKAQKEARTVKKYNKGDNKVLGYVNADRVNFRAKPGITTEIKDCLAKMTDLEILSKVELLEGEKDCWFKVKLNDGRTGFIYGKYVSIKKEDDTSDVTASSKTQQSLKSVANSSKNKLREENAEKTGNMVSEYNVELLGQVMEVEAGKYGITEMGYVGQTLINRVNLNGSSLIKELSMPLQYPTTLKKIQSGKITATKEAKKLAKQLLSGSKNGFEGSDAPKSDWNQIYYQTQEELSYATTVFKTQYHYYAKRK